MRIHVTLASTLACAPAACDHWQLFDPWDDQASGTPSTSGASDGTGGDTTGAPTTSGSDATTGVDATTGGNDTTAADPSTVGDTAGTTSSTTGTTGGSCEPDWEDCENGADDNCDAHEACDGATRAHVALKPAVSGLYVAATDKIGEFTVFGMYTGVLDAPGAPPSDGSDLFAIGYQAATATLYGGVYPGGAGDQTLWAMRQTASGRVLLVRRVDTTHQLLEWKNGAFIEHGVLSDQFETVLALDGDAPGSPRIAVLGTCAADIACVQTLKQDGTVLFANPQTISGLFPRDIRMIPGGNNMVLVAGSNGLLGEIRRLDTPVFDGGEAVLKDSYVITPDGDGAAAQVQRLAFGSDGSALFAAGTVEGASVALGPAATPLCGGDGCDPTGQDLFLVRLAADTLDLTAATRSRGADNKRTVNVTALAVDGLGQFVVGGSATGPFEFGDGPPTNLGFPSLALAFVAKFPAELAVSTQPYWYTAAESIDPSFVTSVALDPSHVVVAARFKGALDFAGVIDSNPALYAGLLLSLAP